MNWLSYLIQVNIYLALFYAFYRLVLHNETFFNLNRLFLLLSGFLSFLIPVMQSEWVKNIFVSQKVINLTDVITLEEVTIAPAPASGLTASELFLMAYLLGVAVASCIFLWKLSRVYKCFSRGYQAQSFFKRIMVSDDVPSRDTIYKHEEVHASQLHSADVIFFELVAIINWFNPVIYAYQKSLKSVHEFIADEVASAGGDKSDYALLLVSKVFGIQKEHLVNNFYNESLLKRRLMMLQKSRSKKAAILKYGFSAPLFALMIIFSSATIDDTKIQKFSSLANSDIQPILKNVTSQPVNISETRVESKQVVIVKEAARETTSTQDDSAGDTSALYTSAVVEIMPEFPGGLKEFLKWIGASFKMPEEARVNEAYGRMILEFIVEKDGRLSNIRPLKDLGYGTAEEGIRVLASSKRWKPGIQNGKPVRVRYVLPMMLNRPVEIQNEQGLKINGQDMEGTAVFINNQLSSKSELEKLPPNNIESVNVIKDKSAFGNLKVPDGTTAIILVKTKNK